MTEGRTMSLPQLGLCLLMMLLLSVSVDKISSCKYQMSANWKGLEILLRNNRKGNPFTLRFEVSLMSIYAQTICNALNEIKKVLLQPKINKKKRLWGEM